MWELIIFFWIIGLFFSLVIFFARNPFLSVIYLIYIYVLSGIILWLYSLEFFGYIYVIVYVGVILVLFLIVIMVTLTPSLLRLYLFESIWIIMLVIWSGLAVLLLWKFYLKESYTILILDSRLVNILEFGVEIVRKLGIVFFSNYFFCVILGLLILIVGCFVISVWLETWLKGPLWIKFQKNKKALLFKSFFFGWR